VREDDGSAAWLREWNEGAHDVKAGPVRTCRKCGREYVRVKGATGTKYCGRECASAAQHRQVQGWTSTHPTSPVQYVCGACSQKFGHGPDSTHNTSYGQPLYLCSACTSRVKPVLNRLRMHRVAVEVIYNIARTGKAECPIDGRDLMTPQRVKGGVYRILMVVDHDHRCCPGQVSKCGRCVRGLLCFRCNVVAGMLDEDPDTARALADHLRNRPALRVVS
jgi:DNA-directed RNA polymerase subunit RPC12/RpoP